MTYFYFEVLVGILLLISLLVYISPFTINIATVLSIFIVTLGSFTDFNYNSWHLIMKILILIVGISIYNLLKPKTLSSVGVLVLSTILASLLIISVNNLLALYICLELQSLSLFIIISKKRNFINNTEAALKYFILSSISSGIFLMGSAIFFCNFGTCSFYEFSASPLSVGKVLVTTALLFKLAAAPLHIWIPDVYQGCDKTSLMILGTLPKISILGVMIALFPSNKIILLSVIVSLIVGCIGAINQTNIKKLLAYSGIINMGFILFGLSTNSFLGVESSIIYLSVYSITFLSIVFIIGLFLSKKDSISEFSSFLGVNNTALFSIAIILFSFAGIPPFAGFFIKWMVLSTTISYNFIFTSIVSILCAIIAGFYYIRIIKISYFQEDKSFFLWKKALIKNKELNYNESLFLGIILFLVITTTIYPTVLLEVAHVGTLSLF